jgi:hypothetical protein
MNSTGGSSTIGDAGWSGGGGCVVAESEIESLTLV